MWVRAKNMSLVWTQDTHNTDQTLENWVDTVNCDIMAKKVTDTKVLGAVAKHFDKFHESENFSEILNNFTSLCELLEIQPTHFVNFYPDLKVRIIFKRSFVL